MQRGLSFSARAAGSESALVFAVGQSELVGVLHRPSNAGAEGVVLIVGGPQYRVGSHRQFVELARALSNRGIAVLRFDYRGLGDSGGIREGFLSISEDIRAAVDCLLEAEPSVASVFLWGLCDAATAASFYAPLDERITGVVLVNPWVRSRAGSARAYVRHYYVRRALDISTWAAFLRGEIDWRRSSRSLFGLLRAALGISKEARPSVMEAAMRGEEQHEAPGATANQLGECMVKSLRQFRRPVQLILSGNDLVASEFWDHARSSRRWRKLLNSSQVRVQKLAEADHTFSRSAWKREVERITGDWIFKVAGSNR